MTELYSSYCICVEIVPRCLCGSTFQSRMGLSNRIDFVGTHNRLCTCSMPKHGALLLRNFWEISSISKWGRWIRKCWLIVKAGFDFNSVFCWRVMIVVGASSGRLCRHAGPEKSLGTQ